MESIGKISGLPIKIETIVMRCIKQLNKKQVYGIGN